MRHQVCSPRPARRAGRRAGRGPRPSARPDGATNRCPAVPIRVPPSACCRPPIPPACTLADDPGPGAATAPTFAYRPRGAVRCCSMTRVVRLASCLPRTQHTLPFRRPPHLCMKSRYCLSGPLKTLPASTLAFTRSLSTCDNFISAPAPSISTPKQSVPRNKAVYFGSFFGVVIAEICYSGRWFYS